MATVDHRDYSKKLGAIVVKAWTDPQFANRLKQDPKAVLHEHGLMTPTGSTVTLLQNTDKLIHLPIPPKPAGTLADEHLAQVAGGGTDGTVGTASTLSCPASTAGTAGTLGSFS
jgi:hypothetical protein